MAGIGFVLKKLLKRDDLSGAIGAYLHGAIASTGPWILTSVGLGLFYLVTQGLVSDYDQINNFRSIILYNFCFSLVFSSPITIVTTRYLSDLIFEKKIGDAPGMLLGAYLFLLAITALPVIFFYYFVANLTPVIIYLAVINFWVISLIWQAMVFVSALKQYMAVTLSFFAGLSLALCAGVFFLKIDSQTGMLAGFNLGLSFILAALSGLIFAEYPAKVRNPFAFLRYFRKYWELTLGGLFYTLAVWVDKWIMWTAPEAIVYPNHLVMYPNYDGALFLASLTMVPALSFFVVTIETGFYEKYLTFYRDIQNHASFSKILENHSNILTFIGSGARNMLLIQSFVTIATIIFSPRILDVLGLNFMQYGIFRYALMGVAFNVLSLFCLILLSYFDNRKGTMWIQALFFLSNGILTYVSLSLGFAWYGWGYFASSLLTFVVSSLYTMRFLYQLPYHAFITSNGAIIDKEVEDEICFDR